MPGPEETGPVPSSAVRGGGGCWDGWKCAGRAIAEPWQGEGTALDV